MFLFPGSCNLDTECTTAAAAAAVALCWLTQTEISTFAMHDTFNSEGACSCDFTKHVKCDVSIRNMCGLCVSSDTECVCQTEEHYRCSCYQLKSPPVMWHEAHDMQSNVNSSHCVCHIIPCRWADCLPLESSNPNIRGKQLLWYSTVTQAEYFCVALLWECIQSYKLNICVWHSCDSAHIPTSWISVRATVVTVHTFQQAEYLCVTLLWMCIQSNKLNTILLQYKFGHHGNRKFSFPITGWQILLSMARISD